MSRAKRRITTSLSVAFFLSVTAFAHDASANWLKGAYSLASGIVTAYGITRVACGTGMAHSNSASLRKACALLGLVPAEDIGSAFRAIRAVYKNLPPEDRDQMLIDFYHGLSADQQRQLDRTLDAHEREVLGVG